MIELENNLRDCNERYENMQIKLNEKENECAQYREERRVLCAEVKEMCGRLESRDDVVNRVEQWCNRALEAMRTGQEAIKTQQEKGYLEEMLMKARYVFVIQSNKPGTHI